MLYFLEKKKKKSYDFHLKNEITKWLVDYNTRVLEPNSSISSHSIHKIDTNLLSFKENIVHFSHFVLLNLKECTFILKGGSRKK